jgi:CheY-like chemotaxis protein
VKISNSKNTELNSSDRQYRVLVVEDDLVNQLMLLSYLNQFNCNCEMVDRGILAINKIYDVKYDIAFIDIGLPDINGLHVHRIKRFFGRNQLIPTIIMTSDEKNLKKDNLPSDVKRYLKKPLTEEMIRKCFDDFLEHR